jgi:hypothetical protein
MLKRLTPYFLLLLAASQALAQETSSCTQTLRLAQTTYENGRLHLMEEILKKCLDEDGFNQEERRQAYKLLVQSYIYLEEPDAADAAMLKLLSTDQFFRPNPDVDPAEFVSLYNRFRTDPLFRWGLKLGPAINGQVSLTQWGVGGDSEGTGKFGPVITFSMGLVFEKDFLENKRLTIAPELAYAVRGFQESSTVFDSDVVESASEQVPTNLDIVIKRKSFDFNPLVKWWLAKEPEKRDQKVEPYLIGGPGISFLTNATFEDAKLERTSGSGTNTGPSINIPEMFKPVSLSAIVGGGARIRLSSVFVHLDARFDFGLTKVIDPDGRTNAETAFDFAWVPNDMKMNMVTINLALMVAQFSPKKLIK